MNAYDIEYVGEDGIACGCFLRGHYDKQAFADMINREVIPERAKRATAETVHQSWVRVIRGQHYPGEPGTRGCFPITEYQW